MPRKTSKQLDREIATALSTPPSASSGRLTAAEVRRLKKAIPVAVKEALLDHRHHVMTHDHYLRAMHDAIKAAGLEGRVAGQPGDFGFDIWEVRNGEPDIDSGPIAGYFAEDDEEDLMEGEDWP